MRPLRFGPLGAPAAIVGAWVLTRLFVLLPGETVLPTNSPSVATATPPTPLGFAKLSLVQAGAAARFAPTSTSRPPAGGTGAKRQRETSRFSSISANMPSAPIADQPASEMPDALRSGVVDGHSPIPRAKTRPLTGSVWALLNGTGGAVGIPSLGGSQTGVRLFLQAERAPFALTARISRALGSARDTEISAGYALRARGLGLLLERRQRLDVKSGAFVVTGYAGAYDVRLPAKLRFDGFAQGGIVGVHSRRWFADGQARVTERVPLNSDISLGAGGGAWASAQQGARRVEAGPLIEARVRAGQVGLRVAGEYRFRLAGDATPRSGPTLSVGLDF